jgi:hypothetical protein
VAKLAQKASLRFPRGSVSKEKVDKATGAKSSKPTPGSNRIRDGPTRGRGS